MKLVNFLFVIGFLIGSIPDKSCAQIITTIAGTGVGAYSGDGGPATMAGCTPFDLRTDPTGNLFFTDRLNQRVRKVSPAGIITTFAGTGTPGFSGDGGPATNATMQVLNGMCFDLSWNMYIADGPNSRVRKVNGAGIISTFAGSALAGFGGDGGPAVAAKMYDEYGVAQDYSGNIYIADSYNNRIRKVDLAGIITTIAGTGMAGFSGDGGPATDAELSWPTGMVFDHMGNLYITDDENNRIRKINTAGIITTIAGSGVTGTTPGGFTGSYTGDGGPATIATLNTPVYLTIDDCGNIYFPDYGNNCVRKISSAGIITTIAGTGAPGFGGDGGPATAALIYRPTGIAIDNAGNILFADQGNNRVRRVTLSISETTTSRDTVVCNGSPVTLFAPAAGPFLWSNADTTASIITDTGGTYWVRTMSAGCNIRTDTVHVFNSALPVNLGDDTSICAGQSITLSPSVPAGSVLTWNTGSTGPSIVVNTPGTYWVKVMNGSCISRDTIQVAVKPLPSVNLGPDQSLCAGNPDTLKPSGTFAAASYLWSNGSTGNAIYPLSSGKYWLCITEGGCTGSDTIMVTFVPDPIITLPEKFLCPGQTLTIGSPEPHGATYLWSTGSTDSSIKIATAGTYSLTVTINGCKKTSTEVVLNGSNTGNVSLGPDTTVCTGDSYVLNANNNQAIWNTKQQGSTITVENTGIYWVTVPEQCGTASDTINVTFLPCDLFFPSGFTPNGDGLNDIARAVGSLGFITGFSLSIYNRWGQRVFFTQDKTAGWDGTFNGIKQDVGVYFYMLNYTLGGNKRLLKGDLSLIR